MKYIHYFTVIFAILCSISSNSVLAQKWKTLNQKSLGLSYKIPHNWYVGGIISEKKYPTTMSALNVATDYSVSMYVKSSIEDNMETLEKQSLWTYTFEPVTESEVIKTTHFSFNKSVSYWHQDPKEQVWKYTTSVENDRHYIIYFWGKAEAIEANKNLIQEILDSTKWLDSSTK